MAKLIGEALAQLHDCNIVHGDLTTSNMIVESVVAKDGTQGRSHRLVILNSLNTNLCMIRIIAREENHQEEKTKKNYLLKVKRNTPVIMKVK